MSNAAALPRDAGGSPARRAGLAVAGALAVTALDLLLLLPAVGGLQALLAHRRALALLATWTVGGIVLALLRPVRRHDPVAERREPKGTLIALLLVPLVIPPVAALGERHGWVPWFARPSLEWTGVAAVAVGLAIRIAGMAQLGSRFSPLVTVQRGHALMTRGIYSVVRHPGYLGALLASAGAMVAFGSALALPLVAGFAGLLGRRIETEDELLEQHFGDEFVRYRERTGGLMPRLVGSRRE